ncbi:hypothetical protein G3A43_06330 [Paraburkholderia aspalathi]|nr:hypothetical protein [Paraburkholderia aspalathi]MBK3779865.1 hypothetical protein [Paraburkholderia aspalathi]
MLKIVYTVFFSLLAISGQALVQAEHPSWRVTHPWFFSYGAALSGVGAGLVLIVLVHVFINAVVESKSC